MNITLAQTRHQLHVEQAQQLARIARDTDVTLERPSHATAAGDTRKLRGIPAIGRCVAGAIPGTSPSVR
jgi:hypothetical protein